MTTLTVAALLDIMRRCAGESDGVISTSQPAEEVQDTSFSDLGYDSLALLETTGVIEREFGLRLQDDDMTRAQTPRSLVNLVNSALGEG